MRCRAPTLLAAISPRIAAVLARDGDRLRDTLQAGRVDGLAASDYDSRLLDYLELAGDAASRGYSVAFLGVTVLALIGGACVAWLVRPPTPGGPDPQEAGG